MPIYYYYSKDLTNKEAHTSTLHCPEMECTMFTKKTGQFSPSLKKVETFGLLIKTIIQCYIFKKDTCLYKNLGFLEKAQVIPN